MRTSLPRFASYLAALFRANFYVHRIEMRRTLILGGTMFAQNLMFFLLWIVFFGAVRNVKGWQLGDVGVMFGMMSFAVGLTLFVADGARQITLMIQDGSIDGFLTRPRHALPAVLLSRSNAASLGDILSGPVYWFAFGNARLEDWLWLVALGTLAAIVFLSALVVFFSLGFWLKNSSRFSTQLFEVMIIFSSIPQHAQSFGTKLVMFSILPAGFINFVPVSLLHEFDGALLAEFLVATAAYAALAVCIFTLGVRRYVRAGE